MKPPPAIAPPSQAERAKAKREAAAAVALRANLARRKAQLRAKTAPPADEKEQKCR